MTQIEKNRIRKKIQFTPVCQVDNWLKDSFVANEPEKEKCMSKILIVDDDTKFLSSTAEMLQKAGFETAQAANTAECLAKAESEKPDLILLDVSLEKGEDGLLAGKDLFHKGMKIPVIILENVAKVATMSVDTTEIAVEAYAEKPLDFHKLIKKINIITSR